MLKFYLNIIKKFFALSNSAKPFIDHISWVYLQNKVLINLKSQYYMGPNTREASIGKSTKTILNNMYIYITIYVHTLCDNQTIVLLLYCCKVVIQLGVVWNHIVSYVYITYIYISSNIKIYINARTTHW